MAYESMLKHFGAGGGGSKKMSIGGRSFDYKILLWVVIAVLLFIFGKKIIAWISDMFASIGIGKDKDDETVGDAVEGSGSSSSPWNPAYWKSVNGGTKPISYALADTLIKKLTDAMGFFNDDEEAVYGVFKQLPSQAAVSFMADRFFQLKSADLLAWLRGGNMWSMGQDHLSNEDVAEIIKIVNKLPKK